jgi:hypothetical protein
MGVLSEVLVAIFSGRLIGFHFLDLDVATEIASSVSSSTGNDALKSVFRALAMASARLSDFESDYESFGSDLVVLLSASCVGSAIFIGDVPSGRCALSKRKGVLIAPVSLTAASFSTGDFLFDVLFKAEIRGRLPDVDRVGGGMSSLSRELVRRSGVINLVSRCRGLLFDYYVSIGVDAIWLLA